MYNVYVRYIIRCMKIRMILITVRLQGLHKLMHQVGNVLCYTSDDINLLNWQLIQVADL